MVGILLVTHNRIGKALLESATKILGNIPVPVKTLSVNYSPDMELLKASTTRLLNELDQGQGVLILTDLYGATPHNISCNITNHNVCTVSGLNMSMLLRTLNYAQKPLDELATIAQQGGHAGIICNLKTLKQAC